MEKHFSIPLVALLLSGIAPAMAQPAGATAVPFEKQVLCDHFVSEGVAVADVNRDGQLDILAGSYWFEAPQWNRHELAVPQAFEYDKGYSDAFLQFALDVDQDGWTDMIRVDFPGKAVVWHKNPGNREGYWEVHPIYHAFGNETPIFMDMDGDGRPDLVGNDPEAQEVIWLRAPKEPGETAWEKHIVSKEAGLGTHQFTHGLGVGEINGDGRPDILINKGWWEAPARHDGQPWRFHPSNFGEDCAEMYTYDVNGDGLTDVISSSAHNYGIWWYEQKRDNGSVEWIKHEIDRSFSQSHGLMLKDVNNDGYPDLVTGKRYFAHNGGDPGAHEPAVLYWYEHTPRETPFWRAHRIDDNSGVGLHLVVEDVDGDGFQDIVVSNKKGVQLFRQTPGN